MKMPINVQSLYWALPLTLVAIALDWSLAPSAERLDVTAAVTKPIVTDKADTQDDNQTSGESLVQHFAAINPFKNQLKQEAETKKEPPVEQPQLKDGEQKITDFAVRLSAIFEQQQALFAVVQVRELSSNETSRKVLKLGSQLAGYEVTEVSLDRITMQHASGEVFELVLFKQNQ